MAVAAVDYFFGAEQQFVRLPAFLKSRFEVGGVGIGAYRLVIIALCGVLTIALQWTLSHTPFGSRLRAAVADPGAAAGLGSNVNRLFRWSCAAGSRLSGFVGAVCAGNHRVRP